MAAAAANQVEYGGQFFARACFLPEFYGWRVLVTDDDRHRIDTLHRMASGVDGDEREFRIAQRIV